MRGHLRTIAAAAVLALLGIGFVVYRTHRHSPIVYGGGGVPISVLVAKKQIQKGTPGDVIAVSRLYKPEALAKSLVEPGAFVDPSTLKGEVAVKDIYPGQQLTVAEFAPSAPSIIILPGEYQRAVVIKPTSPTGQITVGSHVDVWVARNKHGSTFSILHELFQDLYVLNVNNGTVTLRATPKQARKLTYLSAHTNDSIVLRLNRNVSG